MKSQLKKVGFFYRKENKTTLYWVNKISKHIREKYPAISLNNRNPDILVVLGGDGTILEAARKHHHLANPLILGLNLGNVGFLASVRDPRNFIKSIDQFFKGKFAVSERTIVSAEVFRNDRKIFNTEIVNEVVVQSILGVVDLGVLVGRNAIRNIKGSGVLVATATGSTAYNLSAHGPIIAPDIKCLIITEIMDHDIPTPSIVIKHDEEVVIKVNDFRPKGVLSVSMTKEKADVVLLADGNKIFPLRQRDMVKIRSLSHLIKFVEIEKNYFFKSLKDKFSVR